MAIIRSILALITCLLVSFFYFPFEFVALPGFNTKMMLAVLGFVFMGMELVKKRSFSISREFLFLLLFAASVSLASLLSITLNQTPDTTYVSYIVSFSVWLSGAFAICCFIRAFHGSISVQLVLDYLIAVALMQCVAALWIDSSPNMARMVNSTINFGQNVSIETKRLYGFGATLDVAGARFSAILVGIGFFLSEIKEKLPLHRRALYILSFLLISILGNMIARTTMVGMVIGLVITFVGIVFKPADDGNDKTAAVLSWMFILILGTLVCTYLYNTDPNARKLFRFAFEGFFSLAEKGHWEVSSNEKLKTMVVFPETIHTWIIGDGYFMNSRYDINYLGNATDQGFYMGTDVGYLRFIFYFGVIGLIPMMGVIIYSAVICMRRFREEQLLFLMALSVGLIVWLKVSTDILCFFALFLSAAAMLQESVEHDA